ncbi:MAG TPA: hypothetical protein VID25_05650 [Candidatus Limnocylindrales bacterium]|jgi:hypothetical protein
MDRIPNLSRLDLWIAAAGLATAVALLCVAFSEPLVAPRVADAALAMPIAQAATARQAAVELAGRFGLAGTAGAPIRGSDQVTGAIVDTVDFRFADGRLAAEIVRAADGRLQRVVDLTDPPSGPGGTVDAAGAPAAARRLLGTSGLASPASTPVTTWDAGMDAWCVRWVRTIDGVPAPTDGLVTWVRPSGRLKALSDANSRLADAPAQPVPAAAASRAVQGYVRGLHLDTLPSLAYATPRLAWVLPNGFVDPMTTADPSILRLAWTVTFSYIPPGWTERHTVEIDVDATTGALIGGTETA